MTFAWAAMYALLHKHGFSFEFLLGLRAVRFCCTSSALGVVVIVDLAGVPKSSADSVWAACGGPLEHVQGKQIVNLSASALFLLRSVPLAVKQSRDTKMNEKVASSGAERQPFLASDTLEKQSAIVDDARSDDASAEGSADRKKRWSSWKVATIVLLSVLAGLKLHSGDLGHPAWHGRWHGRHSGCKGGDRRELAGYTRFLYGHNRGQQSGIALAEDVLSSGSRKQAKLEDLFLSIPNNASALEASRR